MGTAIVMRSRIIRTLSFAVAAACALWSVLILTGNVFATLPNPYRTLFGIIVFLYGVYRLVLGITRRREE